MRMRSAGERGAASAGQRGGAAPQLAQDLAAHAVMAHNLFADYCFGLGNGPFWTLGLEEQLYAFYALFLLLRRRRTAWQVAGLALLVALAWQGAWRLTIGLDDGAAQPTLGPAPLALGSWLRWPVGLWFSWVLGALAAEAQAGVLRLPAWAFRRRTALLWVAVGLATSGAALELLVPAHGQLRHLPLTAAPAGRGD
jgi:peptidoglycan/LPS O-acetylase OafA/YrhL